MQLSDGKKVADQILRNCKQQIALLPQPPGLALILIGSNPASQSYVHRKKKACAEVGIASLIFSLDRNVSECEVVQQIQQLNQDPRIDGILIQQPLPDHLSTSSIVEAIDPSKDVDGFHPVNIGRLLLGEKTGFIPCTPKGIHALLLAYDLIPAGKHIVIIGRSNIVGKPLAALLVQKNETANATVTLAHTYTKNLSALTRSADIVVAAMGSANFVNGSMVKEGAIVIDVGMNRQHDHLTGDVDFATVAPIASYLTPVPGGVGPMTVAMLMENTLFSYTHRRS